MHREQRSLPGTGLAVREAGVQRERKQQKAALGGHREGGVIRFTSVREGHRTPYSFFPSTHF